MDASSHLLESGQTWVLVGDSITEDPAGYASLCEAKLRTHGLGVRVVNAGVGGNKARDMRARFDRDVLRHKPDWVSISVGVNDVWHGFYDFERDVPVSVYNPAFGESLDEYRGDLTYMVSAVLATGARVVLMSPTMIGEIHDTRENKLLESYVDAMKSIASQEQVSYCPMNESLWDALAEMRESQPDACITTDGVHMTPRGARLMAETLLRTLGI